MYQQHPETYFEIYTKQVSCPLVFLFKHLKLPTSIRILITIGQIVYIYMTAISPEIVSESDPEKTQSQTADKPMAPRGRAT